MQKKYCLDTSALIQPWNNYYSMELCPQYWHVLGELAKEGSVFCTRDVRRELEKQDDALFAWAKEHPHLFREVTDEVQENLRNILTTHRELVNTRTDRSMADPWVIAHAMAERATVVTKEGFAPRKIKIPDVCRAYNVPCIDDFEFVRQIGVKFTAEI